MQNINKEINVNKQFYLHRISKPKQEIIGMQYQESIVIIQVLKSFITKFKNSLSIELNVKMIKSQKDSIKSKIERISI